MERLRLETSTSFDHLQQSEKPLPPTPRRPSSIYTVSQHGQDIPYDNRIVDDYLSTEYLQPKAYRSSTSEIPDQPPARPKLLQLAQTYAVSDPVVERRRVNQSTSKGRNLSPGTSNSDGEYMQRSRKLEKKDAQWHAENYESVLHTRSSTLQAAAPDPYYPTHGNKASPMSPRITDVVDQTLVPSPLRFSNLEDGQEPESRFSSDSSEAGSLHSSLRDSIKKTARKAFHSHKETQGETDNQHLAPPPKSNSRIGSVGSGRRVSLQHGIEDMYDTLTSLYSTSPKAKVVTPKSATSKPAAMDFENTRKVRLPREYRSPAIPMSPYQKLGPKAWEKESPSSKSSKVSFLTPFGSNEKDTATKATPVSSKNRPSSPATSRGLKKPSLAHRLASTLQNGSEKIEHAMGIESNKVKRTRSQKRREELKKTIVVVGLGDRQQAGGGRWV